MDCAGTENAWDGKKRAQISQEKEKFNSVQLLAASGPSPSSVYSYNITEQISVRSRFHIL